MNGGHSGAPYLMQKACNRDSRITIKPYMIAETAAAPSITLETTSKIGFLDAEPVECVLWLLLM